MDMVLIEGFKYYPMPKIELYRAKLGCPMLYRHDPFIIAIAADTTLEADIAIPILNINDPSTIAEFIESRYLRRGSRNVN
jgi:molybdopterin-guanine dinucleotide biosynthesis protein MobB